MRVTAHAASALVALGPNMGTPASVIVDRLNRTDAPAEDTALEVARMTMWHGDRSSSNGDSVIVVIRAGAVITAMLRRSWNQPFTPAALKVAAVGTWL